jgi:hypothetical protein
MRKPLKRLNGDECGSHTGLKAGVNEKRTCLPKVASVEAVAELAIVKIEV